MNTVFRTLVLVLIFPMYVASAQEQVITLSDWTFRKSASQESRKAMVPGCVHLDLMRNGMIKDPLKNNNAAAQKWISETEWTYETHFRCDSVFTGSGDQLLQFDGLDTYAKVYLNDSLILKADNMFRTWSVSVAGLLKQENHLRVDFIPTSKVAADLAKQIPYTLPEGLRSFTRKAQYVYGWDWAPELNSCGIWRPVRLKANQRFRLNDLSIRQLTFHSDTAEVIVSLHYSDPNRRLPLESNGGFVPSNELIELRDETGRLLHRFAVDTLPQAADPDGTCRVEFPLQMTGLQAWHMSTHGSQRLYRFSCSLLGKSDQVVTCTTGFRSIDFINQSDSIGVAFGFRVNGRDVFVRGANLVPPDPFPARIDDSACEALVRKAREANFNMLRVWGGGIYLPESFYDACDQNGILVWQDFMSACSMVPGDSAFRESFRLEAIEHVRRLSKHPCIALWCGNNENDEGWHNWGWQRQYGYTSSDSTRIWNDYRQIFHQILPEVVQKQDPRSSYWPSSPSIGWGRPESMIKGDSHYWGVWWGMEPFATYKVKTGRFMSEYGFQSMPEASSFKNWVDTISFKSTGFRAHQKHPRGFETIDEYLRIHFGTPILFMDYPYMSQLQQAYGMDIAFTAHRSAYPVCRGTLFWQWNDCWPAVSWSALDHLGRSKLIVHAARAAFDSLFVGVTERDGQLVTPLHFDGKTEVSLNFRLMFLNIADSMASPVILDERRIRVRPDTAIASVVSYPLALLRNLKSAETVYYVEVEDNFTFRILSRRFHLPVLPRDLLLLKPEISLHAYDDKTLLMVADRFTYGVYLYESSGTAEFSDNGFNLMPGEIKRITMKGANPASVKWKSYNTIRK
ncbi:MAG: glycosyl hydrolase 2 galactose-binding domain-containing protein [Bacteroidota bacterium]